MQNRRSTVYLDPSNAHDRDKIQFHIGLRQKVYMEILTVRKIAPLKALSLVRHPVASDLDLGPVNAKRAKLRPDPKSLPTLPQIISIRVIIRTKA